ncbi:hypothetical protein HPB48_009876 [Haemaphysalis longicornis]|uniref:Uncharacterized protein n=1 Tax=Haemaphysalis longicornis TaxID=44386 RepID=A0A9J6GKF2_HAELO|nr:hypothetical protein HPB48_009876 [Haemaphysalis longicornis]
MTLLLWMLLHKICEHFENGLDGNSVQTQTSPCRDTFVKSGSYGCKGYEPERVTTYIHILAHHASIKHEQFNSLGRFSSEGIERKKNDVLKHWHHSRSNKCNSAANALKLAKRLETNEHGRTSCAYIKRDVDYCSKGEVQENQFNETQVRGGKLTTAATTTQC